MEPPPLRVRFEIPRAEIDRAQRAAGGPESKAPHAGSEADHLRGRVLFDLGVALEEDPLLRHLERTRGLKTTPPLTVALDQPVAYLLAQVGGGAVLALHGEGEFSIRLTGGRGALSIGADAVSLHLGLPLESYAGTASVPRAEGARAIGAACASLAAVMDGRPALSRWPVAAFLAKEARILGADAAAQAPPLRQTSTWPIADGSLEDHLTAIERAGAHVAPYWRVLREGGPGRLRFEPLRAPGSPQRAGALAFAVRPRQEELIEAEVPGDARATERLRTRLKRRAPFVVDLGTPLAIHEPTGELPMA